jgi:hypothetical protein
MENPPQSWNRYAYVLNNPLSSVDPDGYDCVYLNDAGTDVDRDKNGNINGIDRDSDRDECGENHGYWVDGTVTNIILFTNINDVSLSGFTTDTDGNRTSTGAIYVSATGSFRGLIYDWGYTGLTGTYDLFELYRNRPQIFTIGRQNPLDVAIDCAASGGPKLALDLSPFSLLPDLADALSKGSPKPLVDSGDKMHDIGNGVDLAHHAADALKTTLPFLKPVAKKLGYAGAVISVATAARDFYQCAR